MSSLRASVTDSAGHLSPCTCTVSLAERLTCCTSSCAAAEADADCVAERARAWGPSACARAEQLKEFATKVYPRAVVVIMSRKRLPADACVAFRPTSHLHLVPVSSESSVSSQSGPGDPHNNVL